MSADEQPAAVEPGAGVAASTGAPVAVGSESFRNGPPLSQEFFLRVNDFIQMANRIEKRYDTHHAQLAFLHAFARYSGHHFRTTTTIDDAANRAAFAEYIGGGVKQLILGHLDDMAGAAPATPAADSVGDGTPPSPAPAGDATTPDAG